MRRKTLLQSRGTRDSSLNLLSENSYVAPDERVANKRSVARTLALAECSWAECVLLEKPESVPAKSGSVGATGEPPHRLR
jgi:hypothetical protein